MSRDIKKHQITTVETDFFFSTLKTFHFDLLPKTQSNVLFGKLWCVFFSSATEHCLWNIKLFMKNAFSFLEVCLLKDNYTQHLKSFLLVKRLGSVEQNPASLCYSLGHFSSINIKYQLKFVSLTAWFGIVCPLKDKLV